MQREDIDWKELRGALILVVICISLGGVLLYGSLYFKNEMERDFVRNNGRFKTVSQRYLAVDEEEQLINEYYPRFVTLYNNGVIGSEQRLNWIEVLRDTAEEMKLPKLNYQIESQKVYEPGFSINAGKFMLYSSKMNLQADLLHEGDLFEIFETLNEKARGVYRPTMCNLKRPGRVEELPKAPNINANCELQWYTIKLADGSDINI